MRARAMRAAVCTGTAMAALLSWSVTAGPAQAAVSQTYYLSGVGDDRADGLSPATAWRTTGRANAEAFGPGDRLLLQGGARFVGGLRFDRADAGDPAQPLVVGSWGTGRAVIASAGGTGVDVYDTAGVTVQDLRVLGSGSARSGISFYSDLPTGTRLSGVGVARVEVSGFRLGIAVGAKNPGAGFSDVTVAASSVHHNVEAGLITYGPAFTATSPTYAHTRVTVRAVTAHSNLGDPTELTRNTGSGIVLGSVSGGLVTGATAYANGALCSAPEGPVGIWTYDSTRVVIERSTAYRNRSGSRADGGGFDLDQNVSSSVLQDNLSFENSGPGLLVYTGQRNSAHHHNTVRRNRSVDDARAGGPYGGLTVAGRVSDLLVEGNRVETRGSSTARAPVVRVWAGPTRTQLRANVLVSRAAGPLLQSVMLAPGALRLTANWMQVIDRPWLMVWGATSYRSFSAWMLGPGILTATTRPV